MCRKCNFYLNYIYFLLQAIDGDIFDENAMQPFSSTPMENTSEKVTTSAKENISEKENTSDVDLGD